jgi:membrane-associated phospholipid phosphatase
VPRLRPFLLILAALLLPEAAVAAPLAGADGGVLAGVVDDARALAQAPAAWGRTGWGGFGLALAGVAGLYQSDARTRDFLQTRRGTVGSRVADWGSAAGDLRVLAPVLAGTALWARHAGDGRLGYAAGRGLEAVFFSGAAVGALKVAGGRARPELGHGPHDWDGPRLGPDTRWSFPSDHTASAFSVATVLARTYPDGAVPYAAYGTALLTAFARLEQDQHWASDVWMGAATGLWVGHALTARHPPKGPAGAEAAVLPVPGGAAARLTWRW